MLRLFKLHKIELPRGDTGDELPSSERSATRQFADAGGFRLKGDLSVCRAY